MQHARLQQGRGERSDGFTQGTRGGRSLARFKCTLSEAAKLLAKTLGIHHS